MNKLLVASILGLSLATSPIVAADTIATGNMNSSTQLANQVNSTAKKITALVNRVTENDVSMTLTKTLDSHLLSTLNTSLAMQIKASSENSLKQAQNKLSANKRPAINASEDDQFIAKY